MPFSYPTLPSSDSLRVLVLDPGEFWAPLTGVLEAKTFASKPEYLALSYTWADPYEEHAKIPAMPLTSASPVPPDTKPAAATASKSGDADGDSASTLDDIAAEDAMPVADAPSEEPYIVLNGNPLPLFHNVCLALRFLRSPSHPLTLWVDAICIDQSSIMERNSQVALMAFIFTRATAVISWLGLPHKYARSLVRGPGSPESRLKSLASALTEAWTEGDSRKMAERIAGRDGHRANGRGLFGPQTTVSAEEFEKSKSASLAGGGPGPSMLENSYWERLWVVQEVCIPRNLYFVLGAEVFTEAVIRHMARSPAMDRLLGARSSRFSDAMRLEALIERFMSSGCAETRDRVFALVGLANDVDSFALGIPEPTSPVVGQPEAPAPGRLPRTGTFERKLPRRPKTIKKRGSQLVSNAGSEVSDYESESEEGEFFYRSGTATPYSPPRLPPPPGGLLSGGTSLKSPAGGIFSKGIKGVSATDLLWGSREVPRELMQPEIPPPPKVKRGRGMLEINYERHFYDIWCDIVSFMYYRAKPLLDFGNNDEELEDERRVRVVRFAGVVQRAFEGKVEQELHQTPNPHPALTNNADRIVAKGYCAGTIVHLGPKYGDFVGSYRDQQRWVGSWDSHYHTSSELEKLRQMEETYSAKIIDYHDAEVGRIRPISSPQTRAWSAALPAWKHVNSKGITLPPNNHNLVPAPAHKTHSRAQDPVRFLGTEFCMGLAPRTAQVGDLVIRFWNCDAAIVVRRAGASGPLGDEVVYWLVGRADVAESYTRQHGADNQAKDAMKVTEVRDSNARPGLAKERIPTTKRTKGMYVVMDYDTLQKVSVAIEI